MIFFYISLITYFCVLILKSRNIIILLNNSKGKLKTYYHNIIKNKKKLFLTPEILGLVLIIIALNANEKIMGICFVIFYTLLFLYFLKDVKNKFKLKKGNGLLITILIIFFVVINILFVVHYIITHAGFFWFNTTWIYYIVLIIFAYLLPFIILLCQAINKGLVKIYPKKHKM